jgi:topoisomerase-4 subunit B
MAEVQYTEDSIKSLDWKEHIRLRPGMYIGKLGDGSAQDDGIYVLVKEIIDNSIDEHMMGHGKIIHVKVSDHRVEVRDFGRGIPLGKVVDCVSKINTGGKYDSGAFQKSVGLNGVGTKAVNALSSYFKVQSYREGQTKIAEFERGEIRSDAKITTSSDRNGTLFIFEPDNTVFKNYHFIPDIIQQMVCLIYSKENQMKKL